MKILIVSPDLQEKHGWSSYARHLADCLRSRGHAVLIASPAEGLPHPRQIYQYPWLAPLFARRLRKIIRQTQPDVVHITAEPYACLAPFLPQSAVEKTLLTVHGTYGVVPLREWTLRLLAKRYYRRIPQFICVSAYTRQAVADALQRLSAGVAAHFAERANVVHNGVPLPPKTTRTPQTEKSIILVGGVKRRKGVLEAVEACAAYKRQWNTAFTFTIVGTAREEDGYVQSVRQRIAELSLEENVVIAGVLSESELREQYRTADLLLLPANTGKEDFEGFGLVYIEANAYGVPCIGPNTSGAAEAISEGESGFRCNPHDAEGIAEKMHRILDDDAISPEGCRAWAERHDIERMTEETEAAYRKLKQAR